METPETRYIDREGSAFACHVFGSGPAEYVGVVEPTLHLDLMWVDPSIHANMQELSRMGRCVLMQRRGIGLSQRLDYVPTLEQQASDILAAMEIAGFTNAVMQGFLTGCAPAAMAAAMAPERFKGLILTDPIPQAIAGDRPLVGLSDAEAAEARRDFDAVVAQWGTGEVLRLWGAPIATQANRRMAALLERSSMSPAEAEANFRWVMETDISEVLRSVQVPTRVLFSGMGFMPEAWVQHAADLIPDGTFVRLPEVPAGASLGEPWVPVLAHYREMAFGAAASLVTDRFLGTVLFTDLVGSTETLAEMGDAEYRGVRARHEREVRLAVEESGGELVSVSGDGTLSTFAGPSQAVRCAERIASEAHASGIEVRCGVHTGEIQRDGINVTGMTVHIGARVMAAAGAGEVFVSSTVRDLVVGSGLKLDPRGSHTLKGVPGKWDLHAVASATAQKGTVQPGELGQTAFDRVLINTSRRVPGVMRTAARAANAWESRKAKRVAARQ